MAISLLNRCSDEEFTNLVQNSNSIREIEEQLGYNSYSGSVSVKIAERIKNLNLDISHFKSQQVTVRTEDNVFVKDSTAAQKVLRSWYKKGEYTPYICSICGQEPFWQGKELTLILDHINGNNRDNRLDNLRWVCPNCNIQLDTTGSKNKAYKIGEQKNQSEHKCIDCGKKIQSRSTRCKSCDAKFRIQQHILPCSREELKNLIRTNSFTSIGKQFQVSDNTIRQWCKRYNLPTKVSEIKQISDDVWATI